MTLERQNDIRERTGEVPGGSNRGSGLPASAPANRPVEVGDIKALVVGFGSIGRRHVANLQALGCTKISLLRSAPSAGPSLMSEQGILSHSSPDEAFDARPDIVLITNPTSFHVPTAQQALRRKCHVFIEKPLSDRLDGIDALISESKRLDRTVMVGYNLRFNAVLRGVKKLLSEGKVGRILSARAWVGQYLEDWHPNEDYRHGYMARADMGGGAILTLSHELDYLCWLLGNAERVVAMKSQPSDLEMDTESLAEISLQFAGGLVAHAHLDCLQRTASRGCVIVGSTGTIECDLLNQESRVIRPNDAAETIRCPESDRNQMYLDEMSHFLDCVRSGAEPACSLSDGVRALKVALAAREAAESGTVRSCT